MSVPVRSTLYAASSSYDLGTSGARWGTAYVTAAVIGSLTGVLVASAGSVSAVATLGATQGGTGLNTYTLGDILYSSAANTLAALAGNTTTTRKFLRQTGTGTVSAAPAWDTILAADVPASALSRVNDTNVTLTLGGSPTTALLAATSLTLGWTGILAATRGGTDNASYAVGDMLYANTTTSLARLTIGTSGEVLGVTGGALDWKTLTASDVGAVPTSRTLTMTGTTNQVTVTNSGTPLDLSANRAWTFSLPQDIGTASAPTFSAATLSTAVYLPALTTSTSQRGLKIGTAYAGWLHQSMNTSEGMVLLHNAYVERDGTNVAIFRWVTSHATFGSRGIRFEYGANAAGIIFYADAAASTAGTAFTPTTRFIIGNDGAVTVGTTHKTGANPIYVNSLFVGTTEIINSSGAWIGVPISATKGGTDQSSYSVGDILYANTTTSLARLGGAVAGEFLKASAGPVLSWEAITVADVGGAVATTRTLTMTGTTNQVSVTNSGVAQDLSANRSWTFSLPQNIHTGAAPTFAGLRLTGGVEFVTNTDFTFNAYYSAGWKYRANGYAGDFYQNSSGDFVFLTAPSGVADGAITFTTRLTISNTGGLNTNGGNVTAGTFVGSGASLTSLPAGQLTGTVAATHGGTDNASYTVGDILYANTTTSLAKLGVTGSNNYLNWNGSSLGFRTISVDATNVAAGTFPAGTWAFGATSAVTVNGTLAVTDDVTLTQHLKKVNDSSSLGLYGGVSKSTGGSYVLCYGKSAAGTTDGFANGGATAIYTDDGTGLLIYKTDSTTPTNTLVASFDFANDGRFYMYGTSGVTMARLGGTKAIYIIQNDPNIGFNAYYSSGWKFGAGSSANYAGWLGMPPTTGTLSWVSTTATGNADAAATGTTQFTCDTSGNLVVRGDVTAYGSPSDRRLKEGVTVISNALSVVDALHGYKFSWNDKSEHWKLNQPEGERRDIGFLAQEVMEVLPELVRLNDSGFYSLRHDRLLAVLWEAVRELKGQVNALQSR